MLMRSLAENVLKWLSVAESLLLWEVSMANSSSSGGSIGFFGILGIAFIVLRLCGVIDWPWWAVLAPIWVPIALLLLVLVAFVLNAARR